MVTKNGWVVFWKDAAIWVHSDINKKVKNNNFFDVYNSYEKGLLINYIPKALFYKSIAERYDVKIATKGYNSDDSIWIIPVCVKYKIGFRPDLDSTDLDISYKEKKVTLSFSGNTEFDIRDIYLLRNSDKKRLKKVQNYETYPPH